MKAKDFFEPKVWKSLVDYEKIRLTNIYDNYCQMDKLGFAPNPPDFVVAYNKRMKNKKGNRKRNSKQQKSDRGDYPPSKKLRLDKGTEPTEQSDDEYEVVASESSENTSTTTSGGSSNGNGRKGLFTLEIFDIGDNSKPVTRSNWRKRNDPETSSVEKSRYAIRASTREKKNYNYDSEMEEKDDDIESRDEDTNRSEDRGENPEPETPEAGLPEEGETAPKAADEP